jgi:hypothetical protein
MQKKARTDAHVRVATLPCRSETRRKPRVVRVDREARALSHKMLQTGARGTLFISCQQIHHATDHNSQTVYITLTTLPTLEDIEKYRELSCQGRIPRAW